MHVLPRLDAAFTGLVHSLSTCILLQFFSRSVNIESNFWKNQFFQKTDGNHFIDFRSSVGSIENFKNCFRALTNFTQTKDWMNKITHPILNWSEKIKEDNVFLRSSCNFFKFYQRVNSLFCLINTKQINNCNWIFVSINSGVFL